MTDIDPEKFYWATSSSGSIDLQLPGECLTDICQPGPADSAVAFWARQPEVAAQLDKISPATLRDELREYGAWDDADLQDHSENLERWLWLSACGAAEDVRSGDYQD